MLTFDELAKQFLHMYLSSWITLQHFQWSLVFTLTNLPLVSYSHC
jgi:hypothetical protein